MEFILQAIKAGDKAGDEATLDKSNKLKFMVYILVLCCVSYYREGDLRVIRPLTYVREKDLRNFADKVYVHSYCTCICRHFHFHILTYIEYRYIYLSFRKTAQHALRHPL